MPTRDQIRAIADIIAEMKGSAEAARSLLRTDDQDYYTNKTAELMDEMFDKADEALGFLRLTQAGVPVESRTTPGYRPPTSTKVRGADVVGPKGQPRLRAPLGSPSRYRRGR